MLSKREVELQEEIQATTVQVKRRLAKAREVNRKVREWFGEMERPLVDRMLKAISEIKPVRPVRPDRPKDWLDFMVGPTLAADIRGEAIAPRIPTRMETLERLVADLQLQLLKAPIGEVAKLQERVRYTIEEREKTFARQDRKIQNLERLVLRLRRRLALTEKSTGRDGASI